MKIDLVGPRQRGLAMGLNEFAGYLSVAGAALATGYIAAAFGLRPEPFYLGIACVAAGLMISLLLIRDTRPHVALEGRASRHSETDVTTRQLLVRSLWRDRALSSASQAGMVNNLNDGLAWGLFPLFFAAAGLDRLPGVYLSGCLGRAPALDRDALRPMGP
jgi:MFS family permease